MSTTEALQLDRIRRLAPRGDPTRTGAIRANYAGRLRSWFGALNAVIKESVRSNDIFNIRNERLASDPDPSLTTEALQLAALSETGLGPGHEGLDRRKLSRSVVEALQNIDDPPVFRFERHPEKRRAFIRWLEEQERRGILERIGTDENPFIRKAYARGVRDADTLLNAQGVTVPEEDLQAIFNTPFHRRALEDLFTRNFTALEGITTAMNDQIASELTSGFAAGESPTKIARRITDRVDAIGKTRATVLARTEVINAYSESTLNRYDELGVGQVTIRAEWLTAGDDRVCPICISLEGETWSINAARHGTTTLGEDDVRPFLPEGRSASSFIGEFPNRPPSHPQCRCRLIPEIA